MMPHAALPSSSLILRENIDQNHTEATIRAAARAPSEFSFEQSIVFHIAMPVSVIVKCLVTDSPYKVSERSYEGRLSLEAPPGLIYS